MDSPVSKPVITEEDFRSCYPNVSIQQLGDKGSPKVTQSVEKRQSIRQSPQKSVPVPKTPVPVKQPIANKTTNLKNSQNVVLKTNSPTPSKINITSSTKPVCQVKQTPPKTPAVAKTPNQTIAKSRVVTPPVIIKNALSTSQAVKTPPPTATPVKNSTVKTTPVMKSTPQKAVSVKAVQNIVKQQTPNVVTKVPVKPSSASVKEDFPDQTNTTKVTYHITPQTSQRSTTKQQVVVQSRVPVDSSQVQSVVIGTTAQSVSPVVTSLPQVEITTSEPLQALQVTQHVTLFRPKGTTFTVEDVKKQINLNKQSTMTNVVSSTTNSVPVTATLPTQTVHPEPKKAPISTRGHQEQQVVSPARQTQKVNTQFRSQQVKLQPQQYPTTRGHIKKVEAKKEIPMQKVSPLPPSVPQPEVLANEEEVTTSEEPQVQDNQSLKLIVILPSGEEKAISIPHSLNLNCTISDILQLQKIPVIESVQQSSEEGCDPSEQENYQDTDSNGGQWSNAEPVGTEPGEIFHEVESEELNGESTEQQGETEESQKEAETVNNDLHYQDGLLAVCKFCGYTSVDFNNCQRCKRKLPPNSKTISAELSQRSRKTKADSLTGDSPKKKRICRKKKSDEPVCLTISDDEELLGLSHNSHQISEETYHSDSNQSQMSSCDKEPIITDEMISELKQSISAGEFLGPGEMDDMIDNASPDQMTYLQCRTVRIGSYKVVPKDRVLITPYGLKVTVPAVNSDQLVELKILHHELIRVLTHFGRQLPVLFFYTRPAASARIRKQLNMTDKKTYYYDSVSSDETHRRITLLPDKIDEDSKHIVKTIYSHPDNNIFAELTGKEANDILVKASPKEVQAFILKKQPQPIQQAQPFNGLNIQTIMVYPPPPEKGGIPINTEDYACLEMDQFLNDVIIDFYLKYVVEKTLSPEDRARTHVFSSFFYKRLTTKPPAKRKSMNPVENDPSASPAVKRHSRVKSWTKNVNLFTKDFIVIPINENSHWFLAIVCFPGLTGPVRFSDNTPIEMPGRKKKKIDGKHTVTIGSTTITAVTPSQNRDTTMLDLGDEVEDRDEADGEDERMDVPDEDEDLSQKTLPEVKEELEDEEIPKKKQREPIKQPCILIFDSLAGASRARVVATLRDYLRIEYEAKHGETRDFSGDVLKGTNVRCPQQTNYTDCGLYVLQYVEAFFKWPITDYHIPITQVQDWFQADIVSRKRYEIQQLLLRLMEEQRIDIEALNLPILNLRPDGKHMGEYSGTEEEDEEDDEQMCEDEEDDMLDEDVDYNEEMEHENEEMEIGEIMHHEEDPDDQFLDHSLDHEEHEMDDEEYEMEEEDEPLQEDEMEEEKIENVSIRHMGLKRKDLKKFRIPRHIEKNRMEDNSYKES